MSDATPSTTCVADKGFGISNSRTVRSLHVISQRFGTFAAPRHEASLRFCSQRQTIRHVGETNKQATPPSFLPPPSTALDVELQRQAYGSSSRFSCLAKSSYFLTLRSVTEWLAPSRGYSSGGARSVAEVRNLLMRATHTGFSCPICILDQRLLVSARERVGPGRNFHEISTTR